VKLGINDMPLWASSF